MNNERKKGKKDFQNESKNSNEKQLQAIQNHVFSQYVSSRTITPTNTNIEIYPTTNPKSNAPNIDATKQLQTKKSFVNQKLINHLPNKPLPIQDLIPKLTAFQNDLLALDTFDIVQTWILPNNALQILLQEKKWYHLYMGGGVKNDLNQKQVVSTIPKVQFETNLKLRNLRGLCDFLQVSYTRDQNFIPSFKLNYHTPLLKRYDLNIEAKVETRDYNQLRGYLEFVRGINAKLDLNSQNSLEWNVALRDVIPKRYANYECVTPELIRHSIQPNMKHSLSFQRTVCEVNNRFNPTKGMEVKFTSELALPPGDSLFIKLQGGVNYHEPLYKNISLHASCFGGILKSLTSNTYIGDLFYTGGPMQLRGFGASGIGPKSSQNKSLGGHVYYTASLASSFPIPIENGNRLVRGLLYCNLGNLIDWKDFTISTTRIALGTGLAVGLPMGRLELTYSIPFRFEANDHLKKCQLGFGFSFGS